MLQHPVRPYYLQVRIVTQQRVGQLERIGKRLLRKEIAGADPEHLDVQILKLAVVGLPGQHVRCSGATKIADVEFKKH